MGVGVWVKVSVGWALAVGDGHDGKAAAVENGAADNFGVGVEYTPHKLGTGAQAVSRRRAGRMDVRCRRTVVPP
jgi:hypothetical protein